MYFQELRCQESLVYMEKQQEPGPGWARLSCSHSGTWSQAMKGVMAIAPSQVRAASLDSELRDPRKDRGPSVVVYHFAFHFTDGDRGLQDPPGSLLACLLGN